MDNNMIKKVPTQELKSRLQRFRTIMDSKEPEWKLALIISKVNQYYFTGTMQEGLLLIPRNAEAVYYVRRSYERAVAESLFHEIMPMQTYRDAAADVATVVGSLPDTVHLEAEFVPLAMYERLQKYFGFKVFKSMDACMS